MTRELRIIVRAIEEDVRTYQQIAVAANVTLQTIYNWVNNKVEYPHMRTAVRVANVLGLSWRLVRANR